LTDIRQKIKKEDISFRNMIEEMTMGSYKSFVIQDSQRNKKPVVSYFIETPKRMNVGKEINLWNPTTDECDKNIN
jgi:hypothetical protein